MTTREGWVDVRGTKLDQAMDIGSTHETKGSRDRGQLMMDICPTTYLHGSTPTLKYVVNEEIIQPLKTLQMHAIA